MFHKGGNFIRDVRLSVSFDRVFDLTEFLRSLVSISKVGFALEAHRDPSFLGRLGP